MGAIYAIRRIKPLGYLLPRYLGFMTQLLARFRLLPHRRKRVAPKLAFCRGRAALSFGVTSSIAAPLTDYFRTELDKPSAESVRQPREAPIIGPHRQIGLKPLKVQTEKLRTGDERRSSQMLARLASIGNLSGGRVQIDSSIAQCHHLVSGSLMPRSKGEVERRRRLGGLRKGRNPSKRD